MKLPFTNPKSFSQFLLETLGLALTTALLMMAVDKHREDMSFSTYKILVVIICLAGMGSMGVNSFLSDLHKRSSDIEEGAPCKAPSEETGLLSAGSPRLYS